MEHPIGLTRRLRGTADVHRPPSAALVPCLLLAVLALAACDRGAGSEGSSLPEMEGAGAEMTGRAATVDPPDAADPVVDDAADTGEAAAPDASPSPTPDPRLPTFPYALAFDPNDATRAYFTWRGGLLDSTDGGASWRPLANSKTPGDTEVHHVAVDGTGTIFLAGPANVRFSDDDGSTWQDVPGAAEADARGLAFTVDDRIRLLDGERGVLEPQADGTWRSIGAPPGRAYGLWPLDAGHLASLDLETGTLSASSDDGATWEPLDAAPEGELFGLAYGEATGLLYAATNAGLQRSADGGLSWQPIGPFPAVIGVAVPPDAPDGLVVVIPGGNVYRSDDRGETWPGSPQ